MNRRDLAKALTTTFDPPLSFRDADATLKFVFGEIGTKLVSGEEVSIPGFGRWKIRPTKAGMRRNPQTQEMIKVPASQRVRFYPATALKAEVASGRAGRRTPRAPRR